MEDTELDPKAPQQSPDFPDCFYRVTVKGLIVREGKVLMSLDFVDAAASFEITARNDEGTAVWCPAKRLNTIQP